MRWLLTPAVALAAVLAGVSVPAGAAAHECPLAQNPDSLPVVKLDAAAIDSIGRAISDENVALIETIDEHFREGRYGDPESKEARESARAALIYNSKVAFDFVRSIAAQEDRIFSTSEEDLREAFTRSFRNPGIYPILNLKDARAGLGRFCMQFEVGEGEEKGEKRKVKIAGEEMRAWTEQLKFDDDDRRRVVNIDMKTFAHDRVHVVYERFACGAIREFRTEVDGHPLHVFTMEGLEGQYVRKFGFHKPSAVVLWKSPGVTRLDPPPAEGRFLGSAIYFPHLNLDLPWFLPSIGFDDLRKFEFPEPVLSKDAVKEIEERGYEWLEIKKDQRFADWEGDGDVPDFVNERFPDY